MAFEEKLAETPYGDLLFRNGELILRATVDDPVAIRVQKRLPESGGNGIGKFSIDALRADGVQEEIGLFIFKADERYPTKADEAVGEVDIFLRDGKSGSGNDDSRMNRKLTLSHDKLVSYVPIHAPNLHGGEGVTPVPVPPSGTPDKMRAPGGENELHMQGDRPGALVCYVTPSPDPKTWSVAWVIDPAFFDRIAAIERRLAELSGV